MTSAAAGLAGVRVLDAADAHGRATVALLAALGAAVRRGAPGDAALRGADVAVLGGAAAADVVARRGVFPRLVVVAVTPGSDLGSGPTWRGGEPVLQARGGLVWPNGHPDGPPLALPGAPATRAAALHAALGVVLALLARRRDGRGRLVDVCMQESATALLEHVMGEWFARGEASRRRGSLHWNGTFRIGRGADAPLLLSHLGDWTALREWLRADGAVADLDAPRWDDVDERCRHAAHVFDVLDAWAARYPVEELVARAQALRLPWAPVWSRARFAREGGGRGATAPYATRGGGPAPSTGCASTAMAGAAAGAAPLGGVRVVDFSWVVAGPLATRVLADFGAEVTRIERPAAPALRGVSAANLLRGKRCVGVDLNTAAGRAAVRELLRAADVVVDNFSRRVLPNWGFDDAALRALNPRLVVAHLTGCGAGGGRADWVSYGPTLQALAGLASDMAGPDGAPCGPGFAVADTAAGWTLALAVCAALWRRGAGGPGTVLDLAQVDALAWLTGGRTAPGRVLRCADDAAGERWCMVEGAAPEATWLRRRTVAAALPELQATGVAAGLVATPADLAADPLLLARGWWQCRDGVPHDGVVPKLT